MGQTERISPENKEVIMGGQIPLTLSHKSWIKESLVTHFECMVQQFPNKLALKSEMQTFTYRALNSATNRLARAIMARQEAPFPPIALFFAHDITAIIAMLGALKTGQIFVPLSPAFPLVRLRAILADTQSGLIVTDNQHLATARELLSAGMQLLNVDDLDERLSGENLSLAIQDDTPACIFYTSGSTGQAKGVVWAHHFVLHYVQQNNVDYQIGVDDRLSLLFPFHVGAAMSDIFSALLNGATLSLLNPHHKTPTEIKEWLHEEKMTIAHLPVALFRQFLESLTTKDEFPQLRVVILGGDRLLRSDVARFRSHFTVGRNGRSATCLLVNRLAGTEMGLVARLHIDHTTELQTPIVPVGYPVEGKTVHILPSSMEEDNQDMAGEIAICSPYLALGYWHNPELTQARFLPDHPENHQRTYLTGDLGRIRPDGMLEHWGRKDQLVKIRGYRVELGAIEGAILEVPAVKDAVVIAQDDVAGNKQIVAYLVAGTTPPTIPQLRSTLQAALPAHMMPARFVMLDKLPLLPTGKVDRKGLPMPRRCRPELKAPYVAAHNNDEAQLLALWEKVLDLDGIGIHDNFFELGGHSLLVMSMMMAVERQFGKHTSFNHFFNEPTVAHLATLLSPKEAKQYVSITASNHTEISEKQREAIELLHEQLSDPTKPQEWQQIVRFGDWHRRRKVIHAVSTVFPQAACKLVTRLLCSSRLQTHLFDKEIALTKKFLSVIGYPGDEQEAVARSLLCNCFHYYQIGLQSERPIAGVEVLETAREQGIILVHFHDTASHVLSRSSLTVGGIQNYLTHLKLKNDDIQNALFSSQLNSARQLLEEGGIVKIAPDGHQGYSAGHFFNIHGRHRPFWSSFAELALVTKAAVFAVVREIDCQGNVTSKLVGPLDPGDEALPHAERVERLVAQYVALLSGMWAETPWLVPWYQMERHLAHAPSSRETGNRL